MMGASFRLEYCMLSLTTTCIFWLIQPLNRYNMICDTSLFYDMWPTSSSKFLIVITMHHHNLRYHHSCCHQSHACFPILKQFLGSHSRSSGPRLSGSCSERGGGESLQLFDPPKLWQLFPPWSSPANYSWSLGNTDHLADNPPPLGPCWWQCWPYQEGDGLLVSSSDCYLN